MDFQHVKAITIPNGNVKSISNSLGTLWAQPQPIGDSYRPCVTDGGSYPMYRSNSSGKLEFAVINEDNSS